MIHKLNPDWGTHIPVMLQALNRTYGDVLELGMGISSTPLLHAICEDQNRYLLSLENDEVFIQEFKKYKTPFHEIQLVNDWSEIEAKNWSVILVDNKPESSRKELVKKFANLAKFIIIHDSEPEHNVLYHYDEIYPLFKYRYAYTKTRVHTTVLSNFHEFDFLYNS